jgi:nitrogen regulatory protein P-II 1
MKLVVAVIQPRQLPAVKKALFEEQVHKMTVTNALGSGNEEGYHQMYRGAEREVTLLKKARVEIAVTDEMVNRVVEAIIRGARTEATGDGKIFVLDIDNCIRIRTGEAGLRAL